MRYGDKFYSFGCNHVEYIDYNCDYTLDTFIMKIVANVLGKFQIDMARIKRMLKAGRLMITEGEVAEKKARIYYLLWRACLRELAPSLPAEIQVEVTRTMIGSYKLLQVRRLEGHLYSSVNAVCSRTGKKVHIQAFDKQGPTALRDLFELERMLQGYDLLERYGGHPHVMEPIKMFHSNEAVFQVFEHVGEQRVSDVLMNQGERMEPVECLDFFHQICSGLVHLHSHQVAHLALDLVNLSRESRTIDQDAREGTDVQYHYKIVNFCDASIREPDGSWRPAPIARTLR